MHPLLQRQLKRLGIEPAHAPADSAVWQALLKRVSQSYAESDQGRMLLERSLDVTSREMQGLYDNLQRAGESALTKERNRLEAVLHSLGDGLCVVDDQWKIVLMNQQAERMFDVPLTHLQGTPIYHLVSPGPEEFSHECLVTDASLPPLEQGVPYRTDDGILVRRDGHMLPISLVVTPVATDGVVSGAVLVFRDISAQKRAEEQRAESGALLRRMQAGLLELATNTDLYRGDLAHAFHIITEVAANTLRVARASIWFFTEARTAIRCTDLFEQSTDTHSSGIELPATDYPRYFAELATEDVIVANRAQTDSKTAEFAVNYLIPLGITSMLDVPIRTEGKMVGVICHEHIGPARVWTTEEQQFATSVAGTVSLVLEAADRQKAEQALRENEEKYRNLFESSQDAIMLLFPPEWKFTACNPATVALFGARDTAHFTSLGPWNVSPEIQPDGEPSASKAPKMIMRAMESGSNLFEWTHRKLDGADFVATVLLTRITLKGQTGLQATVRDISEQKRAEDALRTLSTFQQAMLDNAGHAIISCKPDGIIQVFNPAAESLLGYCAEDMIGKQTPAVFHDMKEVATRARLFSAELGTPLEPGFDVFVEKSRRNLPNEHEWTYIRKDGTRLTVLLNITALRNSDGEITAFLGIASDITAIKAVEQELIAARDAAESASVAKSQFLANMSHEIRTPMNGVLGLATLLLQTSLTPKQQRLTETIVRSGTSLLDIINDILDFSKIEAGKLELEQTEFHLRMLLDDVLELFATPAHQKHLELIGDVADTVPAFVKGDPARLRQILINLIGNAIKFTVKGDILLRVVSIAEGEDASVLCFSVKDSGIGIKPESLRTIFQPFAQADGSTTRKYGGTGLGLAIAKHLVGFMGGEIWAESEPGTGSTFYFTVQLGHSQLGRTGALFSKQTLPNQRILVVDDNATLRRSLDHQLRGWGLTPSIAESGTDILQLLAKSPAEAAAYDAILIDYDMPGLDGLETLRRIGQHSRLDHTRLILMTPVERVDVADEAPDLALTTLTKPVRSSELYRILSGQAAKRPPAQQKRPIAAAAPPAPHGVILLAEDNAVNQEVTLGMLEVLGYSATAVENGRLALDRCAHRKFNLILMDCQMPEMDGFQATRLIREREQGSGTHTPIIALTAHALQGDREHCLEAGMDDYLSKPFTLDQLRTILHRWLPATPSATEPPTPASTQEASIPPEPSENAPVDPHAWDSITSLQRPGQPDLLAKVMGLYLKDSQEVVDKIVAAVQAGNSSALRDAAHSLKSRSATLGAWRVAELCKQLEAGGRSQDLTGTAELAAALQRAFAATCTIFQEELGKRAA